jgi:hypothetical protein
MLVPKLPAPTPKGRFQKLGEVRTGKRYLPLEFKNSVI